MSKLRKKYEEILKQDPLKEINIPLDFSFTEDDLFGSDGTLNHQTNLLLGHYPSKVIDQYFTRYKIVEIFSRMGISNIEKKLDVSDPYEHKFYIYSGGFDDNHKVIEIVLKKKSLPIPSKRHPHKMMELLYMEWLLMQNPNKSFTDKRPQLPGQKYPGLRIGDHILEILYHTAKKIQTAGLANSPNYLHTAVIFSKEFIFIDPQMEAIAQATKGYLMKRYSLWTIAWASVNGAIYHLETGEPFRWNSSPMVLPISQEMKNYFNSRWYKERYRYYKDHFRVGINLDLLQQKMTNDAATLPPAH